MKKIHAAKTYRTTSKAAPKEPLPYLRHRPGWRGRLLRLRALLTA